MMISEQDVIVRLLVGALLGAVVGLERERHNQPAGLRTHIILVIGATLAMTLSVNIAMQFQPLVPNGDPARLAAQVVSGIGFLGAGAILRFGTSIKGLTTATSLWTMAVVGLAVGAGHFLEGAAATGLLLVALTILDAIEKHLIRPNVTVTVTITADDRNGLVADVRRVLESKVHHLHSLSIAKNIRTQRIKIEAMLQMDEDLAVEYLMSELGAVPGVRIYKIK